jgi:hypothetical protein
MSHLIRAGLALGLALAGFLTFRSLVLQGAVSEPRLALVAPDKQTSEMQWAAKPARFSGPEGCAGAGCHQDSYDMWRPSAHGNVNCETCHGAATEHKEKPEVSVPVDLGAELCSLCHAKVTGRPETFPQIGADHYPESTCGSCHMAHQPGPPRAITHEVSPGSDCLSCHSTTGPRDRDVPANHSERTNDQCLTCHERRTD